MVSHSSQPGSYVTGGAFLPTSDGAIDRITDTEDIVGIREVTSLGLRQYSMGIGVQPGFT